MKKYLLIAIVLLTANICSAQYQVRYNFANNDSLRTQIRMAAIEVSVERYDTATNASKRLCNEILARPTTSNWLEMFVYPCVILLQTGTPTDAVVKGLIVALWPRIALVNTTR